MHFLISQKISEFKKNCLGRVSAGLTQAPLSKLMKRGEDFEEEPPEKEQLDWWSKYYASMEEIERKVRNQFAKTI